MNSSRTIKEQIYTPPFLSFQEHISSSVKKGANVNGPASFCDLHVKIGHIRSYVGLHTSILLTFMVDFDKCGDMSPFPFYERMPMNISKIKIIIVSMNYTNCTS